MARYTKNEDGTSTYVVEKGEIGAMVKHAILTINTVSKGSDKANGLYNVDDANELVGKWVTEGFRIVNTHVISRPTVGNDPNPSAVQVLYILSK